MKPFTVTEPFVTVPAHCAPDVAPGLVRDLARMRALGVQVQPDTVELIERIEVLAAGVLNGSRVSDVSSGVSSLDGPRCDHRRSMTVNDAATALSISPQAVTGLLRRGTLRGERVGRTWRVDPESVAARRKGRS